jgi:putative redox protein
MEKITAHIEKVLYKTVLKTSTNEIIADEPLSLSGGDLGFAPSELLIASLGACTCITLRMYANRKLWKLDEVTVFVQLERDIAKNTTKINREIVLNGNLTEEERQRLLQIANQCPVHKALTNPITIDTVLIR